MEGNEWFELGWDRKSDRDADLRYIDLMPIPESEKARLRVSGTHAEVQAIIQGESAISQPHTMDHPLVITKDGETHHIESLLPHIIVSDIPLVFITVCATQTLLLWVLNMTRKGTSTSHVVHVGAFLSMAWLTTLLIVWWM